MRNLQKTILFAFIAIVFIGCHTTPRDARQAARDALESACIQLDSGNKADAMRLFKEAERYGLLADDTLTVAYARFNIARCLGVYANEEELFSLLKAADEGFGDNYAERAKVMTFWGDYYQFHRQFDSAEVYLISRDGLCGKKWFSGCETLCLVCFSCEVLQCQGIQKVRRLLAAVLSDLSS